MDLYQLRYFLAVAETHNFSRAAERAFVSQPTLSAGIKKLETELGTPLFHRGKRNTTLTETGARFLPRARSIIYECNAAKQEAAGKTEGMDYVDIPAGRYAVFTHSGHISDLPRTVYTIWNKSLPDLGLEPRKAPDFERYDKRFDPETGRGTLEIWIPIASA